jgi:hypothetical protein
MSDPNTLLANSKCFLCLGITLGEALQLALLDQIASSSAAAVPTNDISTIAADPNVAGLVPPFPNSASTFYQDPAVAGGEFNVWRWSPTTHVWKQFSSPP